MWANLTLRLFVLGLISYGSLSLMPDGRRDVPHMKYAFFVQFACYKEITQYLELNCGGTILDNYHILTASHCLKNMLPKNCVVIVALNTEHEKTYHVANWTMKGDVDVRYHDIGIIKTNDSIVFREDFVEAVALPSVDYQKFKRPVQIIGYGDAYLGPNGQILQNLQKVRVRIHNNSEWCRFDNIEEERWLCTIRGPSGVSPGDSGGPLLVRNHIQIGIVIGAGGFGYDMYTRVYYYLHWIKKQLKKHKESSD